MIIKNANILTFNENLQIIENGTIEINSNGLIESFSNGQIKEKLVDADKEIINANGQFVMPSNICAHTHFYGAFARGLYIPGEPPDAFPEILAKLWWKLDKSLDAEANYFSAMVCLIDAVKHGTTTLIDHHASPNSISGSLDIIEKSVIETGVRASLCYEVTDRDGKERSKEGIEENIRFIQKTKENKNHFINAMFGLHASLTLDDDTLKTARVNCPESTGFHIHAAEHLVDEYNSLSKSGLRVIDRLNEYGILGSKTLVAHGVHLDTSEINLLVKNKTWLSHQPRSNMNNAVGLPNVESMLRAGIPVCLGNDGFSNAMWEEWKSAYLVHKLHNLDPRRMPANLIYQMAVVNNRNLVNKLFDGLRIGIIEKGAAADLMFVDYQPFTEINSANFPWHIIFGFRESMINSLMVNGKFLMRDHKLLFIDEENIHKEALKVSKRVWELYHSSF